MHPNISNLYVTLFEESGKAITQHLIEVNNGFGIGSILLDEKYNNKSYYIRTSTKWSKNFKEDNGY